MNYSRDGRLLKSVVTGVLLVGCGGFFLFLLLGLLTNDTTARELDRMATMRSVQAKGIQNVGNTCFANSVVQMLFRNDQLRNSLLSLTDSQISTAPHESVERKQTITGLRNLFRALDDSKSKTVKDHKGAFIPTQFIRGQAGDAEEFYTAVLDYCASFLDGENFRNWTLLKVVSITSNTQPTTTDFWSSIRVTFPEITTAQLGPLSLDSLLSRPSGPFGEEFIPGKTEPQIYRIAETPQSLVFSFVRIIYNPAKGTLVKIKTPVAVPESIDITPYHFKTNSSIPQFHLKRFILHTGSANGGHYVAYVRETENIWILIDDEKLKSRSKEEALEAAKFSSMCFYEQ